MNRKLIFSVIICLLGLTGCGAPIFSPESELFKPEPEIIEQLEPYLADWATLPPAATEYMRDRMASQIEGVILIGIGVVGTTNDETVYVVDILLDVWGDWNRGYYYVHDGSELAEGPQLRLRKVSDTLYIYNRND